MFKRSLLVAGLVTASLSNVHALPYGFFDARSVGMGNVSVATGDITTAALSNPGMLAVNENGDDMALLFPAIGVQAIDDGNIVDLVDEYQATSDPFRQVEILLELEDASLIAAVIPNMAFVSSNDNFTWGVTVRADVVVSGGVTDVTGVPPSTATPDAFVEGLGVGITEIGVPLGKAFSVAGMELSVGVTPKVVNVAVFEYRESISSADFGNVTDEAEQDLGSFTTLDAGVALSFADSFRVGLVARNLIEETMLTAGGNAINFDTHFRIGAAFDAGFMRIAADMDLTEREPIAFENPSKSLSLGAEIDAASFMQVRMGYQSNMASGATDPDLLSLGLGFWLGFNLDVAVVAGDDSSFGGFIQTSFRF